MQAWIPATVTDVDPETGAARIDVKPDMWFRLQEQYQVLRPRTVPTPEKLEWVRLVMRSGRIDTEATELFNRHARPMPTLAGGDGPWVGKETARALGADVDELLGVSGSILHFLHALRCSPAAALAKADVQTVFWECLDEVMQEHGTSIQEPALSTRSPADPRSLYDFQSTLGAGTYGTVKLALDKTTQARRAIKIIQKSKMLGFLDQLELEIEHLCLLDHPHIVRLYQHHEDVGNIYLVMDFCSGGELQKKIRDAKDHRQNLPEAYVAEVMRQLLMAIAHVHSHGIVHLDLKSANIMLMPSKGTAPPVGPARRTLSAEYERPHVIVIDLGVAQLFRPGNFKLNHPTGTPSTMAPEVWKGEITTKADIFSCGCVFFELLSLHLPFSCPCDRAEATTYWSYQPTPDWLHVRHATQDALQLCVDMLQLDRHRRPKATLCLQRYGFLLQAASAAGPREMDRGCLRQLSLMPERGVLYASLALSLAQKWPPNQMPDVKHLFERLDARLVGSVQKSDVFKALMDIGYPEARCKAAAEAVDICKNGTVSWTDFVASCIDLGDAAISGFVEESFRRACGPDGLLSRQGLSTLLPGHPDELIRDLFVEMTGRDEDGARIDWHTFQDYLTGAKRRGGRRDAIRGQGSGNGGMVGLIQDAVRRLWPGASLGEPCEEHLRQLAEMGFTDRARCIEVLQRHHNKLSNSAVHELMWE